MKNEKITLIIIGNNNIEKCIENIRKQSYINDIEIIVLYNENKEEQIENIRPKYEKIQFLSYKQNMFKAIKQNENLIKGKYVSILNTDKYTLEDVIEALEKPNRDPRDKIEGPILKSDILDIKDLKLGMKLEGTIRNVVPFGAFIDIGLHNDALAHISKLTKEFIKDPNEVVKVGDIVSCYVDEIDLDKNKVSLSLLDPREA